MIPSAEKPAIASTMPDERLATAELADRDELYRNPSHPYTQALMSAIPIPDPTIQRSRLILEGSVPSPLNPPQGCRFHTRCPFAMAHCSQEEPSFKEYTPGHWTACWLLE